MAPGEVMLPRFKIEYEVDLNDVLKALGMAEAFDPTPRELFWNSATGSRKNLYLQG